MPTDKKSSLLYLDNWNHTKLTPENFHNLNSGLNIKHVKQRKKTAANAHWMNSRKKGIKGRRLNAYDNGKNLTLSNTHSKVSKLHLSVIGASPVAKKVVNFKELLRMKKLLSSELFNKLREAFRIIDIDNSGYISIDEVKRVNTMLQPNTDIDRVKKDSLVLFQWLDADRNGYISEMEWLRGWAQSVKQQNYSLEFVREFVDSFYRQAEETNMIEVLQSKLCPTLQHEVFSSVMKWKHNAKETVRLRLQKRIAEIDAQERAMRLARLAREREQAARKAEQLKKEAGQVWR